MLLNAKVKEVAQKHARWDIRETRQRTSMTTLRKNFWNCPMRSRQNGKPSTSWLKIAKLRRKLELSLKRKEQRRNLSNPRWIKTWPLIKQLKLILKNNRKSVARKRKPLKDQPNLMDMKSGHGNGTTIPNVISTPRLNKRRPKPMTD